MPGRLRDPGRGLTPGRRVGAPRPADPATERADGGSGESSGDTGQVDEVGPDTAGPRDEQPDDPAPRGRTS